jgi:hypothetical protein
LGNGAIALNLSSPAVVNAINENIESNGSRGGGNGSGVGGGGSIKASPRKNPAGKPGYIEVEADGAMGAAFPAARVGKRSSGKIGGGGGTGVRGSFYSLFWCS